MSNISYNYFSQHDDDFLYQPVQFGKLHVLIMISALPFSTYQLSSPKLALKHYQLLFSGRRFIGSRLKDHLVNGIKLTHIDQVLIVSQQHTLHYVFGYCYHLVNGISYGLAQSDPIKRHPLYKQFGGPLKFGKPHVPLLISALFIFTWMSPQKLAFKHDKLNII